LSDVLGPDAKDPVAPAPAPRSEVEIVAMRRRHLNQVTAIEAKAMHTPWSLGIFLRELSHRDARTYLVAREGGRVVGFAGVMYVAGEAHITNVSVDETQRNRGIGGLLLSHLLSAALDAGMTSSSLEVRSGNDAAQALYRRFGFAPAGVRKGYYPQTNEDAIVMWIHDFDSAATARRIADLTVVFTNRVATSHSANPPEGTP
jgi:ribosomal-protein-alanine N-acetyltransferase